MRFKVLSASLAAALVLPCTSFGAPLFFENFELDPTANWTVNNGPSDEAHNFFFDYSTVGIPKAPNSGPLDGTRGMKLQANLTGGVFSGVSASPIGQSFTGDYKVKFDWWANYNGPLGAGGTGSTNLSTFGINTAGATAQWAGGVHDSLWFAATGDGGSSDDYRVYPNAALAPGTSGYYAAGSDSNAVRNDTHAYYQDIGAVAAPAAQVALFPQQTEITRPGAAGMQWHEVTIEKTGDIVTWHLGNKLIATVDVDGITFGGSNIFFGHSDINSGVASADAADLLFTLIDNVRVVPEPSALALCLLGVLGLLAARRRR